MSNKRDLRAFVRYDGNQRVIPGSLVLRRSKPKVGDWKEIQTYECCDGGGGTTRLVGAFSPFNNFFQIAYLDNAFSFTANNYTGTTPAEWLTYFNLHFGWMGVFSSNPENPEGSVFFDINTEIFNSLGDPSTFLYFSAGPA